MAVALVDSELTYQMSHYHHLKPHVFYSDYDASDGIITQGSRGHFDVLSQTKTVMQGLETLRNEHNQVGPSDSFHVATVISEFERGVSCRLNGFMQIISSIAASTASLNGSSSPSPNVPLGAISEKANLLKRSLEHIELGIDEAQVCCLFDTPRN